MLKPDVFARALAQALKPLIRIAVKRGIDFRQFSDTVKTAYVEVVQDDFQVPGRKLSIARVALMTGLTRRESARIAKDLEGPRTEGPRKQFNRAARVFDAWRRDAKYLDLRGEPASLEIESSKGIGFTDLVREHGSDVTPRAILDELIRVGAVELLEEGRVRPMQPAYIPFLDEGAKLAILGSDVADLISTIDHNLTPESGEPFFQRKVAYDNLPASYLPDLRKIVRKEAQALLERLSADMSQHDRDVIQGSERGTEPDRHRAMIGIYYFEEECDEAE